MKSEKTDDQWNKAWGSHYKVIYKKIKFHNEA